METVTYLIVALGIAFIIFIHELGHFAVGKFFKFNIEVFSVGFGKAIFKFKRGETEYQLAMIPLGGYVKFKGQMPDELSDNEDGSKGDEYDFQNRPAYQRALVLVAGVTMNVISGIGMIIVAYLYGVMEPQPDVGGFVEVATEKVRSSKDDPKSPMIERTFSPAERAGLKVGDKITSVNGVAVENYMGAMYEIILGKEGSTVKLEVDRDGQNVTVDNIKPVKADKGIFSIGIRPRATTVIDTVANKKNSKAAITPAADAQLQKDDVITALRIPDKEWVSVSYYDEINAFLKSKETRNYLNDNKNIEIKYRRGDEEHQVMIAPYAAVTVGFRPVQPNSTLFTKIKGMFAKPSKLESLIEKVVNGSPIDKLGLKKGDQIVFAKKLGDQSKAVSVRDFEKFREFLKSNGREPFELTWRSNEGLDEPQTGIIKPVFGDYDLGLYPESHMMEKKFAFSEFGALLGYASDRTQYEFNNLYRSLVALFTGSVSAENMGGPIAIVRVSSQALTLGMGFFLIFLAVISFNLAILNILPIPLLDGGHLVLVLIEAVMGQPVNEKVQIGLQYIGMFLLGGLILFVFYNDIFR